MARARHPVTDIASSCVIAVLIMGDDVIYLALVIGVPLEYGLQLRTDARLYRHVWYRSCRRNDFLAGHAASYVMCDDGV